MFQGSRVISEVQGEGGKKDQSPCTKGNIKNEKKKKY